MAIFQYKIIVFQGQFFILSAFSIEKIECFWHFFCNSRYPVQQLSVCVVQPGRITSCKISTKVNGNSIENQEMWTNIDEINRKPTASQYTIKLVFTQNRPKPVQSM